MHLNEAFGLLRYANRNRQGRMLQIFRKYWLDWRAYWARAREIGDCASCDLARIASDIGCSVDDLREVTMRGDSPRLVARLREKGIDPSGIDPRIMRDLQRCCGICSSETICAHEIEDRPVAAKWPAYCPNQSTIDALAAMKCH
jgi:hypothetical protein